MRVGEVDVPSDRNKRFHNKSEYYLKHLHPQTPRPAPTSPRHQQQKCPATCFLFVFSKRISQREAEASG